jgi:hypothetical protein
MGFDFDVTSSCFACASVKVLLEIGSERTCTRVDDCDSFPALTNMPRAKDTKVWNEDLMLAFAARAQQALAEGKSSTIGWNKAAEIIQAVRKDIYKAKTGR